MFILYSIINNNHHLLMSILKDQSNITQFNFPCAFKLTGRPVYLAV